MRKTLIATTSVASLLLAGAAMAQATPPNVTTQTASSHSALIDQIGSAGDQATIHQDDATVTRTGVLKDAAVVIQGGPGFAGSSSNNVSNVSQTGTGQQALTMQANTGGTGGNSINLTQTGDQNHAFGYQFGTGNTTTIGQSMTGGPAIADRAPPLNDQGVNSSADNQKGIDAAVALRTRTTSQARSDVFYNRGAASGTVVQDWASGDTATLTQSGQANTGLVVQSYENGSTAKLTQNRGSNNVGYILQQGSAGTGSGNTATIQENDGSRTSALISQIDSTSSVATTTTSGNNLTNAYTYQTGAQNSATTNQTNVSFGTADIRQSGGFDTASVTQTNTANSTNALIMQGISNSWAAVTQTNANNSTATISQGAVTSFKSGR